VKFWDSSAIVPLLAEEASTSSALGFYRDDPLLFAWWGTDVECVSALARLERRRAIPSAGMAEAIARLRALKSSWQEVQPGEAVRETAIRLLRVHDLRATDSLQLAAAIIASGHRPASLEFVCLDERLIGAARREGFAVLTPRRKVGSE